MKKKPQNKMSLDIMDVKEKIYLVRGKKVMIDRDLAMLYGVPTGVLNQAVRRNIIRFPEDFMFVLTKQETLAASRSQSVILNKRRGSNIKYEALAFTEQGIAMLSSVLNSDYAIAINIQLIRIFTRLRMMVDAYKELRKKVEEMEKSNKVNFTEIFNLINELTKVERKPKRKLGFETE